VSARAGRIGARVKRGDDPRLLTGRGRYVDDLTLPRLVHTALVRSAHAHARLTRLDLDRARRASGVVGVLTGDAVARLCKPYRGVLLHYKGMKTGAMVPLAVDRVRYVGEPIVAIAAETRAAADDAAALIEVEYEPLPAVLAPDAAVGPGAPLIHPELGDNILYETRLAAGDVERAFAGAGRVWTRTFTTGRHTGVPLEPRSLIADYEPATRALTVWISTQVPHMMQAVLAELFSLREPRVRVIAPDVGGSFGIKIHVYQDDMAVCALALTLGRPVKFVASRRESFLSDIHAREQTIRVEAAADGDGVLTAMRASITAAVGPYSAYPRSSVVEGGQVLRLLPGPYRLRHYDAALRVVAQNKVVTSQYRAVGHPIATAVTESMIDLVARDLGLDPAEVRRRNLVRPEDLPYTSATGNVFAFADVPSIEMYHIETPAPTIAGGFKGAGEAGATGAPAAILNAVNDALAPFGVMLTDSADHAGARPAGACSDEIAAGWLRQYPALMRPRVRAAVLTITLVAGPGLGPANPIQRRPAGPAGQARRGGQIVGSSERTPVYRGRPGRARQALTPFSGSFANFGTPMLRCYSTNVATS